MNRRPRIGISGRSELVQGALRSGVNAAYVESVVRAGGLPLVLPPQDAHEWASDVVAALDGLLLTGGVDLEPARYGAPRHASVTEVDRERDVAEFALYAAARAAGTPVFAICRGLQLVNVAHGGTLVQDLPSQRPGGRPHRFSGRRTERTHAVQAEPGTRTADCLGPAPVPVNSFHHQAVERLGAGLRATAHAEDGVLEALEGTGEAWLLAVQWHPEEHWAEPGSPDQRCFAAFLAAARAR